MVGWAEQEAGYTTAFAGKWDAGMVTPAHTPHGRGYQTSLNYFSHKNDFWSQANMQVRAPVHVHKIDCPPARWPPVTSDFVMQTCCEPDQTIIDFWHTDKGASDVNSTGYSEFLYRDELLGVIAKHTPADPLLVFYAPHVAHCPLQVPKAYYDKFAFMADDEGKCAAQTVKGLHDIDPHFPDLEYKCRQQYHAMVHVMDEVVGNITTALKAKAMWDNTLVVMSSDNGGPVDLAENAANNWPKRGGKVKRKTHDPPMSRAILFKHLVCYSGLMAASLWVLVSTRSSRAGSLWPRLSPVDTSRRQSAAPPTAASCTSPSEPPLPPTPPFLRILFEPPDSPLSPQPPALHHQHEECL